MTNHLAVFFLLAVLGMARVPIAAAAESDDDCLNVEAPTKDGDQQCFNSDELGMVCGWDGTPEEAYCEPGADSSSDQKEYSPKESKNSDKVLDEPKQEFAIAPPDKDVLADTVEHFSGAKKLRATSFFATYIEKLAEKDGKSVEKTRILQLWAETSEAVKEQYKLHCQRINKSTKESRTTGKPNQRKQTIATKAVDEVFRESNSSGIDLSKMAKRRLDIENSKKKQHIAKPKESTKVSLPDIITLLREDIKAHKADLDDKWSELNDRILRLEFTSHPRHKTLDVRPTMANSERVPASHVLNPLTAQAHAEKANWFGVNLKYE